MISQYSSRPVLVHHIPVFCILGVFNKSIFFRLDRICEDCYSLFREVELHSLCKWVSRYDLPAVTFSTDFPLPLKLKLRLSHASQVCRSICISGITWDNVTCWPDFHGALHRIISWHIVCPTQCPISFSPPPTDRTTYLISCVEQRNLENLSQLSARKVDFRSHWPMKFVISVVSINLRTDLILFFLRCEYIFKRLKMVKSPWIGLFS